MTQEQLEGNMLIAKFMGWQVKSRTYFSDSRTYFYPYKPNSEKISLNFGCNTEHNTWVKIANHCNFHKNWNKLMTVVEKIMGIDETKTCFGLSFEIYCHGAHCSYKGWSVSSTIFGSNKSNRQFNTRIECVYFVCVEFIKYYNSIKK